MIEDGRRIEQDTVLTADLCIIGAGPAGITIARELAGTGARIIMLELGGMDYEPANQALMAGRIEGDSYPHLRDTRFAGLGGASALWAGWCRPMDAIDFEARAGLNDDGWPFERASLEPFFARAAEHCRIGPVRTTPEAWLGSTDRRPLDLEPSHTVSNMAGDVETTMFQISPAHFGTDYRDELQRSEAIRVVTHAPVIRLEAGSAADRIERVRVRTLAGTGFCVQGGLVVLATGGVENARLLLASGEDPARAIGNQNDQVGRYFTEHAFLEPGRFVPADPNTDMGLYHPFACPDLLPEGVRGRAVFTLKEATLRREGLQNCAMIVMPAYEASPVFEDPGVKAGLELWEKLRGRGAPGAIAPYARAALRVPHKLAHALLRRLAVGQRRRNPVWRLRSFIECQELSSNRVVLGPDRDALGRALPSLSWRMSERDLESVSRAYALLDAALRARRLGRIELDIESTVSNWRAIAYGGKHHMGTTRMHRSPSRGVVDADCRVHGSTNLFIAGSSVFPTVGYVNPTFTLTALAVRLADHLRGQLKRPAPEV